MGIDGDARFETTGISLRKGDVLAACKEVAGYLVCVQGLGWRNDIVKLCGTGKPTLLVDNLFGGSGLFLTRLPRIMQANQPVDWVSSSRDEDLVVSARPFALLAQGKTAAEVAAAFRSSRRNRTPDIPTTPRHADRLPAVNFDEALGELRKTRLLVVGGGWGGDAFRKAAAEVMGVTGSDSDLKSPSRPLHCRFPKQITAAGRRALR